MQNIASLHSLKIFPDSFICVAKHRITTSADALNLQDLNGAYWYVKRRATQFSQQHAANA